MNIDWKQLVDTVKTKNSYKIVIPLFIVLFTIGYSASGSLNFLSFSSVSQQRIAGSVFTGFLAIPGTVLAFATILFAILQVLNRKIMITEMVFNNTFIIPLIYWSFLNIITLITLQIFGESISEYHALRITLIVSYNLLILFIGLIFCFYRLLRYLNYSNITDDYISDIQTLFLAESNQGRDKVDVQLLKQRGKEVTAELTDAIDKEDSALADKYMTFYDFVLDHNPSSNFVSDFRRVLPKLIVRSYEVRSGLSSSFIEFWRSRLKIKIEGKQNFQFYNIEGIPSAAYLMTAGDRQLQQVVTAEFSIRLKEITQFSYYLATKNGDLDLSANFDNLLPSHIEFSELIKTIVASRDGTLLKIVLNDVRMMRETFIDGDYIATKNKIYVNRAKGLSVSDGIALDTFKKYQLQWQAVSDIDKILIGNLSFIYFELFIDSSIPVDKTLREVIDLFGNIIPEDEALEIIIDLFSTENNRFGWDEWIWRSEERLSGKGYALPTIMDIITAGLSGSLLIAPGIKMGRHQTDNFDQLRHLVDQIRKRLAFVKTNANRWKELAQISISQLNERIQLILDQLDKITVSVENDFISRLANSPASSNKIQAFKDAMAQQWESSRTLSKAFEAFNAVEINPDKNLVDSGDNVFYEKGKVMFVDNELYSFIYGSEFGNRVNRGIEARFAQQLGRLAKSVDRTAITNIIEEAIAEISANEFNPTIIFADMSLWLTNQLTIQASGKFSTNLSAQTFDFEIAGVFLNKYPVVLIRDPSFMDLLVVADLPAGLVMQQRQREDYYNKKLILEVSTIDEEKAREMQHERAAAKKEQRTIPELMAAMLIHIHQIYDFEVKNSEAIRVYRSALDNYGR